MFYGSFHPLYLYPTPAIAKWKYDHTNLSQTYRDGLAIVALIIRDAPPEVHIAEEHPSIKAHLLQFVEHLLDEDLPLCSEIEEGARNEDPDLPLLPWVRSGWVLGDVVTSGSVIGLCRGGKQLWRFCWWNWVFERRISTDSLRKETISGQKWLIEKETFDTEERTIHVTWSLAKQKTKNTQGRTLNKDYWAVNQNFNLNIDSR